MPLLWTSRSDNEKHLWRFPIQIYRFVVRKHESAINKVICSLCYLFVCERAREWGRQVVKAMRIDTLHTARLHPILATSAWCKHVATPVHRQPLALPRPAKRDGLREVSPRPEVCESFPSGQRHTIPHRQRLCLRMQLSWLHTWRVVRDGRELKKKYCGTRMSRSTLVSHHLPFTDLWRT